MDSFNISHPSEPKISIGLPVYNAERFIQRTLDAILSQTFTNFELIISDNASTDNTQQICQKYAQQDPRISYIRQEKNMGMIWNFNFVLQKANYDYFVWAGSDDAMLPDFLRKNIAILLLNRNLIGSVGKIERYGIEDFISTPIDFAFKNFIKTLRTRFRRRGAFPIVGSYEEKVKFYLKNSTCQIIYGVFRTHALRKSIIRETFVGLDWAEILNVLKYGDFHIIDEVLMYEYEGGAGSRGIIDVSRKYNANFLGLIFPYFPLTFWCVKIVGIKIFLKNLDFFIRLNLEGVLSQIIDITRILVLKLSKNTSPYSSDNR